MERMVCAIFAWLGLLSMLHKACQTLQQEIQHAAQKNDSSRLSEQSVQRYHELSNLMCTGAVGLAYISLYSLKGGQEGGRK